tara:strand:+ start:208 stop:654 length:447 start_codon:yes stop_codon:yes gene_type:complete
MTTYKIDGFASNLERREKYRDFYATGAIEKGDALCFDVNATEPTNGYGNHVMEADIDAPATSCAIGIATEAAAAGEKVRVQVAGYCDFAQTVSASAAPGDLLGTNTAAGQLSIIAAHPQLAVAIHIADSTVGSGDASSKVFLLNPANL